MILVSILTALIGLHRKEIFLGVFTQGLSTYFIAQSEDRRIVIWFTGISQSRVCSRRSINVVECL